ncbi:MAG: IgGFc-binding protein [Candidatus Kapaibacterium sp.]
MKCHRFSLLHIFGGGTVVLLLLLFFGSTLSAQVDTLHKGATTEGTEFWVVFQKNFRDYIEEGGTSALKPSEPLFLELFITSDKRVKGTIEVSGIGFKRDFTVNAGEVVNIQIDSAAQVRSSEVIEDLAVHIVSDEPIAVYGLSHRYQTTDTYLAYPVTVLGKSYRVMGYKWLANDLLSQMAVIAVEDNTTVTITPSTKTRGGKSAGKPFKIKMDKGQVYQVIPDFNPSRTSDLTGSLIESDKPVAVFSGHNCAYVPSNQYKACNLLVEQMPPLQSWGRQFFVGTLAGRQSSVIRVLAGEDGTEIFENNSKVATLKAGEFYENSNLKVNTMLTATKPILVSQFSKGFTVPDPITGIADSVGDPMMIVVAPTEQFLDGYRFATPVKGSWDHYINIITPTESIGSIRLNGQPINAGRFEKFGISRYSIAQVLIPYGTYSISGDQPFGLYSYGFGYADKIYDAYGNGGGQSMVQVIEAPDRFPPMLEAEYDLANRLVDGIVRDDRVNDLGIETIDVIEFDNAKVEVPEFVKGAPQVPVKIRTVIERQNALIRFRLTDRAGNSALKTVCLQYDEFGDSLIIAILEGDASCSFAPPIYIGGYFNYSAIDNHVTVAEGAELLNNPVVLNGSHGVPAYGAGAFGSYIYKGNLHLTGRLGLDFWSNDAFGYWPDSAAQIADDGTPVLEEFQLHRRTTYLTLAPGIRFFPFSKKSYLFGTLNISLPISTTETYSRTILSPSNYVYENGENRLVDYEGGGVSGFAIGLIPEAGIGVTLPVQGDLTIFGELGAGFTLNSIAPGRGWTGTWLLGRIGATKTIRFK